MKCLEIIGSDVERHACPVCGCHDRERHLLLYLEAMGALGALGELKGKRILHFAPELNLGRLIEASNPSHYTKADLMPSAPGIEKVDLCQMPFPDGSYDVVLANHVLEHIADDRKAMAELYRILAPGGMAFLQTPFSPLLEHSLECPGLSSPSLRWALFGQDDHVRVYGKDLDQRLRTAGLMGVGGSHGTILGDIDCQAFGINPREPLMLYRKKG